jgi:hypothetical protein
MKPFWSKLPCLRDLSLYGFLGSTQEFDLSYQRSIIDTHIVPQVLDVLRVTFVEGLCWYREGGWHPVAPLSTRRSLRQKLRITAPMQ